MHNSAYRIVSSLPKSKPFFLYQIPSFTTQQFHNPHTCITPDFLLALCSRQCKQVQARHLLDEVPHRVLQASKLGKLVHSMSVKLGFASEGKLGNAIVDLYAKCGSLDYAEKAFTRLDERDTLAWNSVLCMYSRRGMVELVVRSFEWMWSSGVVLNQFSYAIVLSGCARLGDVVMGRVVHCGVVKMGFEFDHFCEGSLIDMYAKCGCVDDARRVFDGVADHDTVSWTAMISGYVQSGRLGEALSVFEDMMKRGREPDQVAFVTVISACMGLGRLDDACRLFLQMPFPNAVAWNVMISGHAKRGFEEEAVKFFQNMMKAGVKPTRYTLGSVVSVTANLSNLGYGLQVHTQATKLGLDSNVYVGSSLINMYAKCRKMEAARKIFDGLDKKNIVLWNAMLGGYAQNGYASEVVELFIKMRDASFQPDEFTYTSILSACACLKSKKMGCQLHTHIIKNNFGSNLFVGNALVGMYAKSSALNYARRQFEIIRNRDHVSWNTIIVGYVQNEEEEEAFNIFQRMMSDGILPDEVSLASLLSGCANILSCVYGLQLHCFLIKFGLETSLFAGTSLIDMYAKCGSVNAAREVFSCMPERNVVSMNALIAGYAQTNMKEAVYLLQYMLNDKLKPSEVTFACLLDACGLPSKLHVGKQLHGLLLKIGLQFDDEYLAVSLLGMYMDSLENNDATLLFSEFPNPKSTVVWTAAISGKIQNDCTEEALDLYREMRYHNSMPDQATFVSVLKACALSGSLINGREIHSLVFHTGFDLDELTGSALVDMYAKCGQVKSSVQVFDEMVSRNDVISWNSMIVGFAKNGQAENAVKIFNEMKQANIKPDEVTFLGVLTACSHAGWVFEGRQIFESMTFHYGIQPRVDHCACMIDLFGRFGLLKEAEILIADLEFEHDPMIWAAYLGACKIHGDDIRGKRAAEKLIELEPQSSSPYVLLSNIYAASGNWLGVNSVRMEMKEKQVKKSPGCSWTVLGDKANSFVAGDNSHPSSGHIQAVLKDLTAVIKR